MLAHRSLVHFFVTGIPAHHVKGGLVTSGDQEMKRIHWSPFILFKAISPVTYLLTTISQILKVLPAPESAAGRRPHLPRGLSGRHHCVSSVNDSNADSLSL